MTPGDAKFDKFVSRAATAIKLGLSLSPEAFRTEVDKHLTLAWNAGSGTKLRKQVSDG